MNSLFVSNSRESIERVYRGMTETLVSEAGLKPDVLITKDNLSSYKALTQTADYLFSTWGMLPLTKEEIKAYFPNIKAIFYGAGSVQYFARPFLESGVRIFSAWAANAVPVAEYAYAQILLANKGFYRSAQLFSKEGQPAARAFFQHFGGNYRAKIGILGAGMIGKMVIEKLSGHPFEIYVFDPFLPDEKAKEMGVIKTDLKDIFANCSVISNHLANNEQTVGILNKTHFDLMQDYTTFLNTGRGAQVVEADFCEVLEKNPTITAVLDVTFPEPPLEDSPFYRLPNVFLTPHIAGSSGFEVERMGVYMLEEFRAIQNGKQPKYEVTAPMLETMA